MTRPLNLFVDEQRHVALGVLTQKIGHGKDPLPVCQVMSTLRVGLLPDSTGVNRPPDQRDRQINPVTKADRPSLICCY